jgi:hypothetical protein
MASRAENTQPTAAELADLSALADGTLDPARRDDVEAKIAGSAELSVLYARERRVVEALHQARTTERAPERLRARIEAARPARTVVARRRLLYGAGLAGALAALALALVLVAPGGTPGAPSVSDAASLAGRGPTQAPPAPDPLRPEAMLHQNVGEVYFPNWGRSLGWRAVGSRIDRLGGHQAITVYYRWRDEQIAYTIVSAPALAAPAARRTWRRGTELRTLTQHGRLVVSWYRAGDTCVLSARGVTAGELQKLAAWKAPTAAR